MYTHDTQEVHKEHDTQNTYQVQNVHGGDFMKIISIANQKGGVGKSTTASALGSGLIMRGKKVLFLDIDPQTNLSSSFGVDNNKNSIYEVMAGKANLQETIQTVNGKDIIPGNTFLSNADTEFSLPGREYKLQKALKKLDGIYDYIIIDTPPALGVLTVNALTASNYVLIPAEADTSSIQGISQLYETIQAVKEYCNPKLELKGVLLTRFSKTILSRDLADTIEEIAKQLGSFVYQTRIRECIALKETKTQQTDIFTYAPKSNAALDYDSMVDEFLANE